MNPTAEQYLLFHKFGKVQSNISNVFFLNVDLSVHTQAVVEHWWNIGTCLLHTSGCLHLTLI